MSEKNEQRAIYVKVDLWEQAMKKAKSPQIDRSLSQIIRRLLEMWLNDEVAPYPEKF